MNNNKPHITPPRLAEKLLSRILKADLLEEVLGDLDEKFYATLGQHSPGKAKRNYWYQTLNYLRPFAIKKGKLKYSNTYSMHKHFLKVSWRNLARNKVFSSIKIGGFAIGIAACILIALFVKHESGYDQHYTEGDRIFRITNSYSDADVTDRWTNLHGPLKDVYEDHLPEAEKVARTVLWSWGDAGENHVRPIDTRHNIHEDGFFYADPELLEILEVPMVYGDRATALTAPNSIVISKSKADKYFPGQNPLGLQLVLNDNPKSTFTVGGVMQDFPKTSHLQGDFIMTLAERTSGPGTSGWCCSNYTYYIRLSTGANKTRVEEKMVDIRDTYVFDELRADGQSNLEEENKYRAYYLQPVANIYLNEEGVGDYLSHGSADMVWTFGAIAAIILLLASINFINLTTAKSITRAKEIGMRKVVGSNRAGLIYQHLAETVFYSLLSVLLGGLLAEAATPLFNQVSGKALSLPWLELWFVPALLLTAFTIGLLSGIYPAFYLSRFNPIQALKGKVSKGKSASGFRNGMVVFQFTTTVVLIISALVTHQQFEHYMSKSIGYEKDQVVNILGLGSLEAEERDVLKDEVMRLSTVENATLGDYIPVAGGRITNFEFWLLDEKPLDNGFEAARWIVDEDYLSTMGMELVAGRDFTEETSDEKAIIINESMAEAFGREELINTEVIDMFDGQYRIIGIVKDFYFESLTGSVRPLAMVRGKGNSTLSVKLSVEDMTNTLASLNAVWDQVKPTQPIRYSFMDQRFALMYEGLHRSKSLFIIFATLSIIIASLGLFALSAYSIEQRKKEVSVRKVLGASVGSLFALLASNFIKLILLSVVIAIPIGNYLMNDMLEEMGNHITLSWPLFALAATLAIIIGLITVSFESIKAAMLNPAQRLRSE